jgi:hypothetical protein
LIILSRCRRRAVRAEFRRPVLSLPHRAPIPPLVLRSDQGTGLRVRFHHAPLAAETVLPGTFRP